MYIILMDEYWLLSLNCQTDALLNETQQSTILQIGSLIDIPG